MKQMPVLSLSLFNVKSVLFFFFFANLARYLELRVPLLRLSSSSLEELLGLLLLEKVLLRLRSQFRLTR